MEFDFVSGKLLQTGKKDHSRLNKDDTLMAA